MQVLHESIIMTHRFLLHEVQPFNSIGDGFAIHKRKIPGIIGVRLMSKIKMVGLVRLLQFTTWLQHFTCLKRFVVN